MSQTYDVSISRRGGFNNLAEARAHRNVVGKLTELLDTAKSTAEQLKGADLVDIASTGSDFNKDLAAGKGHVVMLTEGAGAELTYNPTDGSVRSLVLELPGQKFTQMGSSYKLEEGGITTYCQVDQQRGVLSIMDAEQDVPRIFGDVKPQQLTAGTFQLGKPILIF